MNRKIILLMVLFSLALILPGKAFSQSVGAGNPPDIDPPKPPKEHKYETIDIPEIQYIEKEIPDPECPKCKKKKIKIPITLHHYYVVDTGCISLKVDFGRSVHGGSWQSGYFQIEEERASKVVYSLEGLRYVSDFTTSIVSVKTNNIPTGAAREVTIARPNGYFVTYSFAAGSSKGYPIGAETSFGSYLEMLDANLSPVSNDPAFYDRVFEQTSKARYSASDRKLVAIIAPNGRAVTPSDPRIAIEIINDANGIVRQVRSGADGLADIVAIDEYSYEIRLYPPENAGAKNQTTGLYEPTGAPRTVWKIENPARDHEKVDHIVFTENTNSNVYVYDWNYVSASNQWSVSTGNGAMKASKSILQNSDGTERRITSIRRNAQGNVTSKETQVTHKFEWGEEVCELINDPNGASGINAERQLMTYYEDKAQPGRYAHIRTLRKPDGYWERYDYDSGGRLIETVVPASDSAYDSPAGQADSTALSYISLDAGDVPSIKDSRPRIVERRINGIPVEKTYYVYKTVGGEPVMITEKCSNPSNAYGNQANQRETTIGYPANGDPVSAGRVKTIIRGDGEMELYSYEYGSYSAAPDPASSSFAPGGGDAIRQTVVYGTTANPSGVPGKTVKTTKVYDGRGDEVLAETYAYDGASYAKISWTVNTYDSTHHVISTYKSDGTHTSAVWNCCNKQSETTADGAEYAFGYNLLKQMISKTKVGGPTIAYTYDVEEHQLSETISGGGTSLSSSATYDLAGRVTSRTDAAGLVTTYEYSNAGRTVTATLPGGFTEITDHYLDGKIKSVTGTAAVAKYYTYGVNNDGAQWTKICTAVENGSNYVKTTADALDRTVSEERPGATSTLVTTYFYNTQGLMIKTTSTGNADTLYAYDDYNNQIRTALDLNSNGQIDLSVDDRVSESETSFQSVNSQWWSVTISKVYGDNGAVTTNVTKKQLTGLASGTIANTISTDINGNDTVSTTTLDRTNKTIVQTVTYPDSNVSAVSTTVNGLLVSQTTKENLTYNFSYDGVERKIGDTDPRTGSSVTHYNALGQVDYVQDAAGKQTSFTYEANTGRRSSVVNALNKATNYTYNSRGQIVSVRGDASYPLDYSYDSYGRMTQLSTYRNTNLENPDVTTWAYQESTGLLTSKTYADNKSVSYTYSADGNLATRTWSSGVVTNYAYNLTGDLTGITYSDTTPAVAFTYNRLGQQVTVMDAVGSRTFGYDNALRLSSEAITGIYNKTISRSYDALGRSSGMNIGTEYAVGYGYDTLGRFNTVTNGNDTFTYGYLANSNLIQSISYPSSITSTKSYEEHRNFVTSVENKYGTTTISKYDYTNDDLGRRTAMAKSGTAFSQSDTITYGYNDRSEVTSAVATNQATYNYGFSFDPIGNRTASTSTETGTSVTRNYTSNNLNQYTAIDNPAQAPTYDLDGNTTTYELSTGYWTFTWDAENRMSSATNGNQTLQFKYDYMSRRVEKRVLDGESETKKERFVYDKYLQVEQLNAMDNHTIEKVRIWGLEKKVVADVNSSGTSCYALGDANKNITEYLDAAGTVQGHYEFSVFGKVIVTSGSNPDAFDFRFSSEYLDRETGLVYYNFRYYDSETGRWLSRDPIEEKGGRILYGFCNNDAINGTDRFGLFKQSDLQKELTKLNEQLKKEKCCCPEGTTTSMTVALTLQMNSGQNVKLRAKAIPKGCVEGYAGYYWWDCATARNEAKKDKNFKQDKEDKAFVDYGWRGGGETYTDGHPGEDLEYAPGDPGNWAWQAAIIYIYCTPDCHRAAKFETSNLINLKWEDPPGTWILNLSTSN